MKNSKPVRTTMKSPQAAPKPYELRLYVAGQTPKSLIALANLKNICEAHLHSEYRIEVIDLLERPQLARGDQILAIPTLVRTLPQPIKKNHRRSVKYRASSGWTQPKAIGLTDL